MIASSISAYHRGVRDLFGSVADALARSLHFVRRRSPLTGSLFAHALVFTAFQQRDPSLSSYAETIASLDARVAVTPQAVEQRFTPQAVALLKSLLGKALRLSAPSAPVTVPLLERFNAVYLLDSTVVALPEPLRTLFRGTGGSASASAVKMVWIVEWLSGRTHAIELRDGRGADQGLGMPHVASTQPGALWLFDLGFWSAAFFGAIADFGSFFLSRLQPGVRVWERTAVGGRRLLDVDGWLDAEVTCRSARQVEVGSATAPVGCRLVAEPVPVSVADERRRKLRRAAQRQGRTPRESTLRRQGWSLWVTNAREEQIGRDAVPEVARVRWQIELVFKLAKSEAGLASHRSQKPDRVQCELYARLIALVCFGPLLALAAERTRERLSAVKAWRVLRRRAVEWGRALRRRHGAAEVVRLLEWIGKRARFAKRTKTPSTLERLARAVAAERVSTPSPPIGSVPHDRLGVAAP